ncbi:CCA tRNA nucleotidyltransferase [Pseudophaeobacter flagellatus]|uniref:CCA tRNA nucleotidyltransferase n=1 Tax=Pseudophaeobacter flagellatus TaxID=2899119 RepID=UPI001E48FAEE|nr:CCA tRNA nucleotidyltransferase [Pseudophaeobacter flagellatus]MCD9147026.1 CCA tRNA nucleotidyltransferase [Pseudophaeobacter flagellatus]
MTSLAAQPWLHNPATQQVCAALTAQGAAAYFVGGCVRNALMGVAVSDIDIATNATPQEVLALAQAAGIKAIPTGIDHGTVTLVANHIPHEVTTFRKDVTTDGRRAVVAFSKDIAEDAARRDFTMNALYARPDGRLVDPLQGLADLQARRVRFIGTARNRIREDYLRILRYFRFHAWYGDAQVGFDPDALAAIADNLEGLSQLSLERVSAEMLKLLAAADPAPAIAVMRQLGVLGQVLPGSHDRALAPLVHLQDVHQGYPKAAITPDPICRLAALGGEELLPYLRLSKAQARRLQQLRGSAMGSDRTSKLSYQLGPDMARSACLLRAALLEQPVSPDLEPDLARGAAAVFPVVAADLMPDLSGPALGAALKKLQQAWIDSGFDLTREDLLQQLK